MFQFIKTVSRSSQTGFTLIEVLITLSIVAILLTIGMPAMRDAIFVQKVKSAVTDIHVSLSYARSEAIKRNSNVDIVPVVTNSWMDGWNVQTGGTTLKALDAYPDLLITGPLGTITYQRNGRLSGGSATGDFNVYVSGNANIAMRCVVISANGMPHIDSDSDSDPTNGCN